MTNEGKRKVPIQGKMVPGTVVRVIRAETEPWTECLLADGTLLRFKLTVYEATKLDDAYENDGTPIYIVKYGVLQHTIAPEALRAPAPE